MKNCFIFVVYALFFISCESISTEETTSERSTLTNKISPESPPSNSLNSFDYVGQVHDSLLHSYYADSLVFSSIDSIIQRVNLKASYHPFFTNFPSTDYTFIPVSRISFISSNSSVAFDSIVTGLSISTQAKIEFRSFVSIVLDRVGQNEDPADIHNFIVNYESNLQQSNHYTSNEKAYLLMVTSILRHSVHTKGKRPKKNTDPDWDWLTANIAGALDGAQYGGEQAILSALKAGIIENR